MIIFDLDKTLFNTPMLKEDFEKVFERNNLRGQEFFKTFYRAYDSNAKEKGCYSIDKHLALLKDFKKEQKENIKKELILTMESRGSSYLYQDVLPILNFLKQNKQEITLLTKGDKDFQNFKIRMTGLDKFFNEVKIVSKIEPKLINNIISGKKDCLFMSDSVDDLRKVQKAVNNITCVFIRRYDQIIPHDLRVMSGISLNDLAWYFRTLSLGKS
jgi:FMN phosphatase YigB (HAD superfamily)